MFRIHYRLLSVLTLLLIGFSTLVGPRSAAANAAPDERFAEYWQANGGLPVFGYAISAADLQANSDTGRSYVTQWYERNRFELHEENRAPYNVLLGRLGVDRLEQLGRNWQHFLKASPNDPHYFAATGHAIAHEPFWRYWSSHGLEFPGQPGTTFDESLALFGMPLSEPMMETNTSGDRVLTQWFERARFEDHGPKGVLLGLLGNEVRGGATPQKPVAGLKYFWPRTSPLTVLHGGGSAADERGFVLHLAWPHETEPDVTISGGTAVTPPEGRGRAVTIRGRAGSAYVSATHMAVFWTEDGERYMITGSLLERELLAFAGDLEVLDLRTFQERVQPPREPAGRLQYFWPRTSPLTVWHQRESYANEHSFVLHLAWPHATAPDATITGGAIAPPPEGRGTEVTVRGQRGTLHNLGARLALAWTEDGQFYMIDGTLSRRDLIALAEDLEALDIATFQSRLHRNDPVEGLKYLWPGPEQHELSVLPSPHGGSWADEDGFQLNLYRVHSRQPDVTITGGTAVQAPGGSGRPIAVRGQQARAYTTSRGATLVWTEDGHRYMVASDLSLPDLLDLTSLLQELNLSTFRSRIQPE